MTSDARSGVRTHTEIDRRLCGEPVEVGPGRAVVRLRAREEMAADHLGLVHGGFVFGLADYAAMLAVNEPTVVLVSAETHFQLPVRAGEELRAVAAVVATDGHRHQVEVSVWRGDDVVLDGLFHCAVTRRHVLEGER